MAAHSLMCVWEAVYATEEGSSDTIEKSLLQKIIQDFSGLPGAKELTTATTEAFNESFPSQQVDFGVFTEFIASHVLEKDALLLLLLEEIEKVCWDKCKKRYSDLQEMFSGEGIWNLWQIFNRLSQVNTYPAVVTSHDFDWLVRKLTSCQDIEYGKQYLEDESSFKQAVTGVLSSLKDLKQSMSQKVNRDKQNAEGRYSFKQLVEALKLAFKDHKLEVTEGAIKDMHNWIVLDICHAGWLTKRNRRQANWTNWVKRWFVLTPSKLIYYSDPSLKTKKGEISVNPHSIIEGLPDIAAQEYKARIKISNSQFSEMEISAADEALQKAWIEKLNIVTKANAKFSQSENVTDKKFEEYRRIAIQTRKAIAQEDGLVVQPKRAFQNGKGKQLEGENGAANNDISSKLKNRISSESTSAKGNGGDMLSSQNAKIKSVFSKIDTNGNGMIEFEEFIEFIKTLGLKMEEKEIILLFYNIDKDKNNVLYLDEFQDYFLKFILDETKHDKFESSLRSAFIKADRDGTGTVDFKELSDFVSDKKRNLCIKELMQYMSQTGDAEQELSYDKFKELFSSSGMTEALMNESDDSSIEEILKSQYINEDMGDLGKYLQQRWTSFAGFKRHGGSGNLVMKGADGIVGDVVPGEYSLVDLACFSDLPPIVPKCIIIKGFQWVCGSQKSGKAIFPPNFNKKIPLEIATNEHLAYYGASFADTNQVKVSLLYRHGIQDFTYENNYLDDYVTNEDALDGAGIEKHEFSHLDCPLDQESGVFVLGKLNGDELHLTGFKVPTRHTLYIPGGTIHCNDYLKGTWRTMLSDEVEIDHVQLCKTKDGASEDVLEKFNFEFADSF